MKRMLIVFFAALAIFSQAQEKLEKVYDSHAAEFKVLGGKIFARLSEGGIIRSSDNGKTWEQVNSGLVVSNNVYVLTAGLAVSGENLFTVTGTGYRLLFSSTNMGESWEKFSEFPASCAVREIAISPTGQFFIGTFQDGILISNDSGKSWIKPDSGGTTKPVNQILFDGNRIFAATEGDGVLVSNDGGKKWIDMSSGFSWIYHYKTNCIRMCGPSIFLGTAYGLLLTSAMKSESWKLAADVLKEASVKDIAVDGKNIFVGGSTGLYFSDDWGTNWRRAFPKTMISSLLVNDGYLFMGIYGEGTYRILISELFLSTPVADVQVKPAEFSLSQNYPNPFNPETTIEYSVAQKSHVSLRVFNLAGKEVATLDNGIKSPGAYQKRWDATNFSTGIYFYRLEVNGQIQFNKKMTLVR